MAVRWPGAEGCLPVRTHLTRLSDRGAARRCRSDRAPRRSVRREISSWTTRAPRRRSRCSTRSIASRDLVPHRLIRQLDAALHDARREPRQRLLRRVRVNRRQRARVAGVQRLQQVERFPAAHLADDDAVRSMPQRRPEQVANRHGRQTRLLASRLEPDQVRPVDLQLRRVLDQHDAVVGRQERRERVQQRRLARARAAADQDVLVPARSPSRTVVEHVRRHRADPDEFLGREEPRLKLANGQRRAAEAARRKHGRHARAVRQPRVEDRLLLGDVVAERPGDVLDGDLAGCARRAARPSTSLDDARRARRRPAASR